MKLPTNDENLVKSAPYRRRAKSEPHQPATYIMVIEEVRTILAPPNHCGAFKCGNFGEIIGFRAHTPTFAPMG